jgi:hypothetical protein
MKMNYILMPPLPWAPLEPIKYIKPECRSGLTKEWLNWQRWMKRREAAWINVYIKWCRMPKYSSEERMELISEQEIIWDQIKRRVGVFKMEQ